MGHAGFLSNRHYEGRALMFPDNYRDAVIEVVQNTTVTWCFSLLSHSRRNPGIFTARAINDVLYIEKLSST